MSTVAALNEFKLHTIQLEDEVLREEAQTIFFQHVQHVIFEDHEIRTLQGLLVDYNRIVTNHGHSSIVKSGYLKEILPKEFGKDIGFHVRTQKNVSELVYDTRAAGISIEVAISSLGVSDDQLKMIDPYVILAMPFISFLVVVIYIIEIPSFYFGNAT